MPRPPIARTCGKCTWVSTNPGQHQSLAQVDDLVVRVLGEQRAAGPRATITPSRTSERGVRLGAQVVALEGALRGVEEGAAEERHRRAGGRLRARTPRAARPRRRPRSRPVPCWWSRRAGRWACGSGRRRRWSCPSASSRDRNRAQLGRRADQPDRAEVVEPDGGVARGRRPRRGRGSSPAGGCRAAARRAPARAAPAPGARARRRRRRPAGRAPRRPGARARESTRCRSRSWRARMRASSRPTWPTPKIATLGTTGSGSSSTDDLAAAALHAVLDRRLVGEVALERLGPGAAGSRAAPAHGVRPRPRGCRRRPSPTVRRAATTILAPASRGAWPRTSVTVTSTPASRDGAEVGDRLPPGGHTRHPGPDPVERPVDRLRRRRRGELDGDAGRPERRARLAQRLAHARTPASAAVRRRPSSRRPRRPRGRARAARRGTRSASPRSSAACTSTPTGCVSRPRSGPSEVSQRRSSSVSQPAPCTNPPSTWPRSTSGERLSPTSCTMSTRRRS